VIGNGAKAINDGVASLIARAIATRTMLLAGRDDSIDAMASRLGVRRDYLAVLVRLSYLSPEIIRTIVAGNQPIELTPTRLYPGWEYLVFISNGPAPLWQDASARKRPFLCRGRLRLSRPNGGEEGKTN